MEKKLFLYLRKIDRVLRTLIIKNMPVNTCISIVKKKKIEKLTKRTNVRANDGKNRMNLYANNILKLTVVFSCALILVNFNPEMVF